MVLYVAELVEDVSFGDTAIGQDHFVGIDTERLGVETGLVFVESLELDIRFGSVFLLEILDGIRVHSLLLVHLVHLAPQRCELLLDVLECDFFLVRLLRLFLKGVAVVMCVKHVVFDGLAVVGQGLNMMRSDKPFCFILGR